MRSVLYTADFEPITIVDLPGDALALLEQFGMFFLTPPPAPVGIEVHIGSIAPALRETRRAKPLMILGEPIKRREVRGWMLFVPDEEEALLLRSVFIPGQTEPLNEAKRLAYARGFVEAFKHVRKS